MDDCELIALITAAACAISNCCPEDEIPILAAAFTQLGDTLATVIVQREIRESKAKKENNDKDGNLRNQEPEEDCGYQYD